MCQDPDEVDISREQFRQRFQIGVQRRLLGLDLPQAAAVRVLADPDLLEAEYQRWRARTEVGAW